MSSANLRFVSFDFQGTRLSLEAVGAVVAKGRVADGEVGAGAIADGSSMSNDEVGGGEGRSITPSLCISFVRAASYNVKNPEAALIAVLCRV